MNYHSSTTKKYYPILIGAALLTASLFRLSLPAFSAGTEAGQTIRNSATGTYFDGDPNDANTNQYTIDSNTVEVTVSKVAGIINQPSSFNNLGQGGNVGTSIVTDDIVEFEFTITNVGNDVSDIYVPAMNNIDTRGLTNLQVSIQGVDGTTFGNGAGANPPRTIGFNASGTDFVNAPDVSDAIQVQNVPINGQIVVKVTGTVGATAAGAAIEVKLGDTPPNTAINAPVAETQNQDDGDAAKDPNPSTSGVSAQDRDIRTIAATGTGANSPKVSGAPTGGEKEASAVQRVFLGSTPLALAKIEKVAGNPTVTGNTATIPYSLELEVQANAQNPLFTPSDLEGREYTNFPTNITATNLVLIADAIPAGTTLANIISAFTENGRTWTPVYTQSPLTTLAADATWVTTPPALDSVTRIGWIYDADANGAIPKGTIIPASQGAAIPGFKFNVNVADTSANNGQVANIAQVFGSTDGLDDEIFDESGDQDPSNFNGTTNVRIPENNAQSTGVADPATHGIDVDNNNTAVNSPGGEDNVITFDAPGNILNGPDQSPNATGNVFVPNTIDNNHDFQNKGISNFSDAAPTASFTGNPQEGRGDNTLDPEAVVFNNTLRNPGGTALSQVLLQPVAPEFGNLGGINSDLPTGTKVIINLGTQQAIYTYGGNGFALDPDDQSSSATRSQAIEIAGLGAGASLNYTVTVDLPNDTELSTNADSNGISAPLVGGFPVPIIAFEETAAGTAASATNFNLTVNQVYTGFIKITKERAGDNNAANSKPGDEIEYVVEYRNISEPQAGSGNNLILQGQNVIIEENGTTANISALPADTGNNWALDLNNDDDLDTINVQNSAIDSNDGTIEYYTGTTPEATVITGAGNESNAYSISTLTAAGTTDPGKTVTGYSVTIPTLDPAPIDSPSTFSFKRKIDEFDGLADDIDNQTP